LLFEYRASVGFPLDEGPMADTTQVKADEMAVYINANRDNFCLNEVCDRLVDEGARAFFFYIPDEYWSGKVTTHSEVSEVDAVAQRLSQDPALSVHCQVFKIEPHRAAGRSRIQVETHARNEALSWIRAAGFNHILVVDGDELWRRGTMAALLTTVNDLKPQCVFTGMIPTIGVPGYPVDGATDSATIYVGRDALFSECRNTAGTKYQLNGNRVIHFSATRRTLAEVATKCRESGHYDDANYDFEGWIKGILPSVHVGMTNVHMYRPYNPWKRVRAWTKAELTEIPVTLHPYLAVIPATNPPLPNRHYTAGGLPKAN
jgi:hypothetical protein